MVDEISDRISDWLPDDITARHEIDQALKDSGWSDDWDSGTRTTISDFISKQRSPDFPEIQKEARRRTTVMGRQGDRQPAIRAADGTTLGDPKNVKTWEDTHGNIMGHNTRTGERKKITDSEDRQ